MPDTHTWDECGGAPGPWPVDIKLLRDLLSHADQFLTTAAHFFFIWKIMDNLNPWQIFR
jgi:hypothetical protein